MWTAAAPGVILALVVAGLAGGAIARGSMPLARGASIVAAGWFPACVLGFALATAQVSAAAATSDPSAKAVVLMLGISDAWRGVALAAACGLGAGIFARYAASAPASSEPTPPV